MTNVNEIIRQVWPLIVIQLALQIYALYDLIKKKSTKNLSPLVWGIIIVLGEIVGPILYLLLGKKEE